MSFDDEIEILLVEDNPYDAELAITAFQKNNLANNIIHVKDGVEALDFLQGKGAYNGRDTEKTPKLILLDLKLPKLSGLEVLKQLKSETDTKTIPVVILTSSTEEADLIESYNLGVNSYLVKPVDFDKFGEVIRELGMYWLLLNKHPQKRR